MILENEYISLMVSDDTGSWKLLDKRAEVLWESRPDRFGEVSIVRSGETSIIPLIPDQVVCKGESLILSFRKGLYGWPVALDITLKLEGQSIDFSYEPTSLTPIDSITLLDDGLVMKDEDRAYLLVPARLGLLIPSDSGMQFTQRFKTFAFDGCSMEMLGAVKNDGALLLTWHDPYVVAEVKSVLEDGHQRLSTSLRMSKSARSFKLHALGVGDLNLIAGEYRKVAQEKGWLVTWDEKIKEHPQAEKLFGVINFKLWAALERRVDEDLNEFSVDVNWTFDEAAQVAEHLKNELELDKVLFILGGWTHKGYDCQHPDILPAAPECGGNEGLQNCIQRVQKCGYLFGVHDNYQDMYLDAPSWNEDYIAKNPDGSLIMGGLWLGGRCCITCSKKAVELAKRPQNLPKVKELFNLDVYFTDTTYTSLLECFDKNHPLTKWDDMHWKQTLSDYARELIGLFSAEDGQEWAIPHADLFEGLSGLHGEYYRNFDLKALGGTVAPIFEMVYHDCIAIHGKYSYTLNEAAEYVLHHVSIARTLNYHGMGIWKFFDLKDLGIGTHLYWINDETNEVPFLQEDEPDKACFTRAHNGWAEGMCLTDRFIKNTYEILSPINELTSRVRLTSLKFLTSDRRVRETRFGDLAKITVNGSDVNFAVTSESGEKVWLPPFGFLIESPHFVAFHALNWNSKEYKEPVLFTLRSLDGKPIAISDKVKIYHGFGDTTLSWKGSPIEVERGCVVG